MFIRVIDKTIDYRTDILRVVYKCTTSDSTETW